MEISRYSPKPSTMKTAAGYKQTASEAKPAEKQVKEFYTPSKQKNVKNMSSEEKTQHIEKLRQDADKHFESLKNLVAKMLEKQGYTFQDLQEGNVDWKSLEADEETRLAAAAAVAEDGPYGAEAVSDRLVNFAIALSGGDVDKLGLLRGAIDQGFEAVKDVFGELPEVSVRTYDLIQEKLTAWETEKRSEAEKA